jgi:hypothetical protein
MKHNIPIAVAALAVAFGGCNARTGAERSANTVTVSGCVQSAEQGLGSSDKKDVDKFMLTNANVAAGAGVSTSPAPADRAPGDQARSDASAPPAAATSPSATSFALDGKASELRQQLNHQVEITGRLANDTVKDTSSAAAGRQELKVDSVRMIAAMCNP